VLRGDVGFSLISGRSVPDVIRSALPTTLEFALLGMAIALAISVPVGVISSVRQDSWLDYVFRGGAIAAIAVPAFWVGIMSMAVPGYLFGWLPPSFVPWSESPPRHLYGMAIPSAVLGLSVAGTQIRIIRTAMLNVLREDYVRTARAKGLSSRSVVLRHAMRNAVLPLVTLVAIQFSILITGTVVLERVYGIPGLGQQLLAAISARDYPVIQGINLVFAIAVVTIYFAVDLLYALLDPRVRFA
jgi:peptide/nickel transport system permease protein